MSRCASTAPDNWQIRCELQHDHRPPHRSNMVTWRDPEPVDLERESDAWVNGQVVLEHEREPDIGERVCSHGLRFSVHCKQCSFAGFCGCRDCVEAA